MGWQPIETAPKDGTRVLLWIMPVAIAIPYKWDGERCMGDDYPFTTIPVRLLTPAPTGSETT